jgi:hypothetical protein
MKRRSKSGPKFAFETLENRSMLAGTVTTQLVKGDLVVKGDNNANIIAITQTGTTVTITGTGTTVNTSPVLNVTGRIKLDMKGGDDQVTITGTTKGIEADMGDGLDTFTVQNATVNGEVEAEGEGGNDTLQILGSTVNGDVELDGDAGNDNLTILNTRVNGDVEMEGSSGNDMLLVQCQDNTDLLKRLVRQVSFSCTITGDLEMDGGESGTNQMTIIDYTVLGETEISGGKNVDTVNVTSSTLNSFEADTGGSGDFVNFSNTTVNGDAEFDTGDGSDQVSISNSTFHGETEVETGDGTDTANITACTFNTLDVDMGKGNDTLLIATTTVTTKTTLDGGSGTDTFITTGAGNSLSPANRKVKNFEIFTPNPPQLG